MKAVKSGYYFNLFTDEALANINLRRTDYKVKVNGQIYYLFVGATFDDGCKVDKLLDQSGELFIDKYRVM